MINSILGIQTALAQTGTTAGNIANDTQDQISDMVASFITRIPLFLTALIIAVVSYIVARIVKSAVENRLAAQGFEEEHKGITSLSGRLANIGVLTLGITIALRIAGIDITSIIAAGAFAIGFALKDILMNFIAGAMILISKHYTIGDVIDVNGTKGTIEEIQTRATILKGFDGTRIVVPNSVLFKNKVISFTSNPFRKFQVDIGLPYGIDLQKAMDIMKEQVQKTRKVLVEPKPSIWLVEWGDYSINFKINAWVESRAGWIGVRTRLIKNIDNALKEEGIEIPFPITSIDLINNKEENKQEKAVKKAMEEKSSTTDQSNEEDETEAKDMGIAPTPEQVSAPEWLKSAAANASKEPQLPTDPKDEIPGLQALPEATDSGQNQNETPVPGIEPVQPTQPVQQQPVQQQPQVQPMQPVRQEEPVTPPPVTYPNNQ
ncbi:mechanosensitive ion channel [Candidatus Peregrinibacteria bacterium]|nr:mechanosensitive ion channel [Candidatus Peregrinibacteria bacterium]